VVPIGRRIIIVLAAGVFALSAPASALACLPYTHHGDEDGFKLADGVRWAFVADVIDDVQNPEVPDRPQAMVLRVRELLAGDVSLTRLRIEQDDGCDGFWYRKGDLVIAAIGRVRGIEPPFAGITNYNVAVWVIRDGAVDGTIRVPAIAGRVPETERELRALLGDMPDTATIQRASPVETPLPFLPFLPFVAVGAILTAVLTFRGVRRTSG
jgi:hypothetical protein